MTNGELMDFLENCAKTYRKHGKDNIKRNTHMHDFGGKKSNQTLVDAVLVTFINEICYQLGGDSGYNIKHLKRAK